MLFRKASDTRPLGLKNADTKMVMRTVIVAAKHVSTKRAAKLQRGFIPNRQLLTNVVDIDCAAQELAMEPPGRSALLPFASASISIRRSCHWHSCSMS